MFAAESVLKQPDPNASFIIQADATDVAVGAVFLQRNNQGVLCVYTSQKHIGTECQWAVWGKEAYTVCWALLAWRHFL